MVICYSRDGSLKCCSWEKESYSRTGTNHPENSVNRNLQSHYTMNCVWKKENVTLLAPTGGPPRWQPYKSLWWWALLTWLRRIYIMLERGIFFFFLKFQKHYLKLELCGNPLQYSCLENPRDRGAWWAAVFGVAHSQTWLKQFSSSSSSMYKLGTQPGIWQVLLIIIVLIEGLSLYWAIFGTGF